MLLLLTKVCRMDERTNRRTTIIPITHARTGTHAKTHTHTFQWQAQIEMNGDGIDIHCHNQQLYS